jgi:hypothetical protein
MSPKHGPLLASNVQQRRPSAPRESIMKSAIPAARRLPGDCRASFGRVHTLGSCSGRQRSSVRGGPRRERRQLGHRPRNGPGPGARIGDQFILYRAGPWIGGFRDPGGFKWATGEPFLFRDFPFSHVKLGAMVGPVVTGAIAPVALQR